MPPRTPKQSKQVESIKHGDDKRKNIPTAEHQSVMADEERSPIQVAYERRNRDLDPQLVWRGKDEQDWSDLVVSAPPLYIQEKVHPKVLVDDLLKQSKERSQATQDMQLGFDLFGDFDGLPEGANATDFYQHDANWTNRMILGDSLQVMASLAEREGLRGKVQCIYFDPPYGIKFNSNFQWSTKSRDVKDGKIDNITREPEQVKAFRDTWKDGIHSYLTYLRDRLTVARDLLSDSGALFLQIGEENIHLTRSLLDEIFGTENCIATIIIQKVTGVESVHLTSQNDYILFYSKRVETLKSRPVFISKEDVESASSRYSRAINLRGETRPLNVLEKVDTSKIPDGEWAYRGDNLVSSEFRPDTTVNFKLYGSKFHPGQSNHWKTSLKGMERLSCAN